MLNDAIAHPRDRNNTGTAQNVPDMEAESAAERTLDDVVRILRKAKPDQFERVLEREWKNRLFDLHGRGLLEASQIASHFWLAADGLPSKQAILDAFCIKNLPRPVTLESVNLDLGITDGSYEPGKEPHELIKRILPRDGVTMIGGQSGAGKTFALIAMAMALATKTEFLGFPVREKCGVIICAAEGAPTLPARLEAARKAAGVTGPLPIRIVTRVPNLSDVAQLESFVEALRLVIDDMELKHRVRVGVVAIDTIASAFSIENENDNSEAAHICKTLALIGQHLRVAIVPVHHFGKSAEQGLRGASAWRANVDHAISILAERDPATGAVSSRSMSVMKSRIGEEGPVCCFALASQVLGVNRYGEDVVTCSVAVTDAPPPKEDTKKLPNAKTDRQFSKAFDDAVIGKGERRRLRDNGPEVRMVQIEEVRKEFCRRHISGNVATKADAMRMAWRRALQRALEGGAYAAETDDRTGLEMIWDTMAELPFMDGR